MACSPEFHETLTTPFCPVCGNKAPPKRSKDEDYVTVMACVNPQRALVAVMRYERSGDGYTMKRCSEPLSQRGAAALAQSWAAALGLEVR